MSTQTTEFKRELVQRLHLPFEVLSDRDFLFTKALGLPTFEFDGIRLLKRMAWYYEAGKIIKVFYPVFPPDQNASTVLNWLKAYIEGRWQ
jgi:peroxiredoxin